MATTPGWRNVDLPGRLRLAYQDWGGAGVPLVLVHGLASSATIWNLVAPRLAEHFRVLAIDQRGHGRSERPDGSFDFQTYVADLRAFLDQLGLERAILVGHSWGGNVVLQFGVDEPARTLALVLVDGGFIELSARPGWSWERVEQELAPPDLNGIDRQALLERASRGDLAEVWGPDVADSVLGHFEPLPGDRLRPWLRREHHMQILQAMWRHRPSELWSRLNCPVLLVPARPRQLDERRAEFQRDKDAAVTQALARLADAHLLEFENTVHDVPVHRPAELAAAITAFVENRFSSSR